MRHGTNGFISLPKEGVLGIFSPWKIRRLRPGLNPRIWVPKASTLPLKYRSRLSAAFTPRKYSWYSFLLKTESTPRPQCGRKDYVNEKFQTIILNVGLHIVLVCRSSASNIQSNSTRICMADLYALSQNFSLNLKIRRVVMPYHYVLFCLCKAKMRNIYCVPVCIFGSLMCIQIRQNNSDVNPALPQMCGNARLQTVYSSQ